MAEEDETGPTATPAAPSGTSLGDLVGAILSQLSMAQAHADQATVNLSQVYLLQPLLKRFSVPRMELKEVQLELKVAFAGVTPSSDGDPALAAVQVLSTAEQLSAVPAESLTTIKLTVHTSPRRLTSVDDNLRLVPD